MNIQEAAQKFQSTLQGYEGFWCVAGGWAIDLYLNRDTRPHEDLEIIILREEQKLAHSHFKAMQPSKIITGEGEPKFVLWQGEEIEKEVIQLRLNPIDTSEGKKEFDILLTPSIDKNWICRRDEKIQLPLEKTRIISALGVPVLNPEIVLLFKAKHLREHDVKDFQSVLPSLSDAAKIWLAGSLEKVHPGHKWITALQK